MRKITLPALACLIAAFPARAEILDLDEAIPVTGNPAVENQMKGVFPREIRPSVPSGAIQDEWARAGKTQGVRAAQPYDPGRRIDLVLRERITTTIALPEWDSIEEFVVSDPVHFNASRGKHPWMLHVWPRHPGADGNLTIIGQSGLWYLFRLAGHTNNSKQVPDLFYGLSAPAPRFSQSGDGAGVQTPAQARAAATSEDWLFNIPYDPSKLRQDLEMKGDSSLAPVWVARDEHRTYLFYEDRASAVQGIGIWKVQDKVDQQVNWTISPDNKTIIVHWAGPLTLRNGNRFVCVRPRA